MAINPASMSPLQLTPSTGAASLDAATTVASGSPSDAAKAFGSALSQAVNNLQQVQSQADQAMVQLSSGQPVDLHDVMIKTEQANLTFQLGLQVRQKVMDAYQQVAQMQV